VLRAILKSKGEVLKALQRNLSGRLSSITEKVPEFRPQGEKVMGLLGEIINATTDPSVSHCSTPNKETIRDTRTIY